MPKSTLLIEKRDSGTWAGTREGSSRASFLKDTKKEAVKEGHRYLYDYDDVKKMVIHKGNGEVDRTKKAPKNPQVSYNKEDLTTKEYTNGDFQIVYDAWKDEALEGKLDKKDIGCRVHIAGEKGTEKTYLENIHQPGDPEFPDGGYTVRWKKKDYKTAHFYDEVRLHHSVVRQRLRKQ